MTLASDRNVPRLRQESHRSIGGGNPVEQYGEQRHCNVEGCEARLSRYNPGATCTLHRGWDEVGRRSRP